VVTAKRKTAYSLGARTILDFFVHTLFSYSAINLDPVVADVWDDADTVVAGEDDV
jgi:hypothetical protein